jgi:hypothetical protein
MISSCQLPPNKPIETDAKRGRGSSARRSGAGSETVQQWRFIALLAIVSLTAIACQWSIDFAVANSSPDPIELTYRLRRWKDDCVPPTGDRRPMILPIKKLRKRDRQWEPFPDAALHWDPQTCEMTLSIGAGDAVRIAHVSNGMYLVARDEPYSGPETGMPGFLQGARLKTKYGGLEFKEAELLRSATEERADLYVLWYDGKVRERSWWF